MPKLPPIESSPAFRRCRRKRLRFVAAAVCCLPMAVRPCAAQDIEPRRWSHLPMGSQTLTAGYATTEGEIFLNPVLRIEDAEFELNTTAVKYIRTFAFLGKSARVDVLGAWQSGEWSGLLDGMPASTEREGWSDATVRFAINLLGAPPLETREFAAYRAKTKIETIAGAALAVQLPTGDYMEDKLINLGNNRFAFTPQFGVVHNHGRWSFECTASATVRTDNDSFFNGRKLEEDPLYFLQGHAVYNFRPGLWLAGSAGWGWGSASVIDGVPASDRKEFLGWGLSFGFPLSRSAGFKLGYIGTRNQARTGYDSDTFSAGIGFQW